MDKRRCTILDLALEINDARLIKSFLLFFEDFENAVFAAVHFQSLRLLEIALEVNSNWNGPTSHSRNTPLHKAVSMSSLDISRHILMSCGGWEARNSLGETPLFFAVKNNKIEQAILLIQYGANFRARDYTSNTLLHVVCSQEEGINIDFIEFLLDLECNPNALDQDGRTPLQLIAKNQIVPFALDSAKILIRRGADVNLGNEAGETPLHILAQYCDPDNFFAVFNLFLESGVDTKSITHNNETFLDILLDGVCLSSQKKVLRILILKDRDGKFQFGANLMCANTFYFQYEEKCRRELCRLESKKIDPFQTQEESSLLKILKSNEIQISKLCKNPNLRSIMSELDESQFSIYGFDLRNNFELGLKLFHEEEQALEFLYRISNGVLDYDSMIAIMKYIPLQELGNLGKCLS
ncbi:transient receptor potential channel pyrexia-like [Harmonia axyridis]|uniref:transient receptor potential channel pyrexia-like n=1 Tax=Harmonia axyridis TaxID=115357 RepID=UPI001E278A3E|nr:transient receptor potential channel pyrexia-like [Harmonia axyridis]